MHITSQPYLKTYTFTPLSVATSIKISLIILSISLPFFITYSTPNFYMTSHLITNTTQPINYNYKYHIQIITTTSSYIYTNLFIYSSSKTIYIQQSDDNSIINFKIGWSKTNTNQRVLSADITLFFNFVVNGLKHYGMASGKVTGYSISQASIVGYLTIKKGTGQSIITQNDLTLNGYNLLTTQLQMTQSSYYLNYQYSSLPINYPTDMVQIIMCVNYGSFMINNQTPSILGQLVWSWIQYFPIFLTIYWLLDKAFCFILRQKIIRSNLSHDRQYLSIINNQNTRREILHQIS